MTRPNIQLLALLLFSVLITYSSCLIQNQCPPEFRNPDYECPDIANLVCAYFTGGNCDSDTCQKLSANSCIACKDPSVQYYTDGICEREKVFCDPVGREHLPLKCDEYSTVCAYYEEGCPVGTCAEEYWTSCAACRDPDIIYYERGQCQIMEFVKPCRWIYYCNETDFPHFEPYRPVCGFDPNCTSPDCTETVKNQCILCDDNRTINFKEGVCDKDRIDCDPDVRPQDCSGLGRDPVCATFPLYLSDGIEVFRTTTVDNSCNACKETSVKYYVPDACPASFDNKTYCLPSHPARDCPDTDEPVCGWKSGIGFDLALRNVPNGCQACQDPEITYYKPGPCNFKCRPEDNNDVVKCNGSLVEPVCARYTPAYGGEPRSISVKNKCVACFDLPLAIDSYTEGLCEGQEGIQCENEPWSYYYGSISPVCGIYDENCEGDSCGVTYAEPVLACQVSEVAFYKPGMCPGDQGIDCGVYRGEVCSERDFDSPVCGYTERNCQDSSCRGNYRNQCYACENSDVQFFTDGRCD